MKKIGIVIKSNDKDVLNKAKKLEDWLISQQIEVITKMSSPPTYKYSNLQQKFAPKDLLCTLVLGGDGTFLHAVRWIKDRNIPIMGVKFGEVGFLAIISEDNLYKAVKSILMGKFTTEKRMLVQVSVIRNESEILKETVLNDVVINKGALARLLSIETYIDNHYLTTYRADGLIISTPTGSTAYSIAAGGPVIHPKVPAIIMTPICPFTLTNRPLLVPDSAEIKIKLKEKSPDIMLTFDGQVGCEINEKDIIIIKKASQSINMITLPNYNYFDILKSKLRWSGGRS